jgi:hypothetical protein
MQKIAHVEVNRSLDGMYERVKDKDALETNEERDRKQALKDKAIAADLSYQYE